MSRPPARPDAGTAGDPHATSARRAHADGGTPTLDDPARGA